MLTFSPEPDTLSSRVSDRVPLDTTSFGSSQTSGPLLRPAPGRSILRIVPRLGLKGSIDTKSDLVTPGGLELALDGRYPNQPMLGQLHAIGDPTSEREAAIAAWARDEAELGHLFVFSQYGAGTPYWEDAMRSMLPAGYDFRWLQGFRLFDIGQLSATVSGTGAYGEIVRNIIVPPSLQLIQ